MTFNFPILFGVSVIRPDFAVNWRALLGPRRRRSAYAKAWRAFTRKRPTGRPRPITPPTMPVATRVMAQTMNALEAIDARGVGAGFAKIRRRADAKAKRYPRHGGGTRRHRRPGRAWVLGRFLNQMRACEDRGLYGAYRLMNMRTAIKAKRWPRVGGV